ncbi:hypothetical protein [Haloarchaeobius sp. TZWWS8]|uniref:hypothetical protein n=1 Tax=Haloarchaeobius sp. TZWWS8 TaxID=3446121 RepID=UPI003EBB7E5C
MNDVNDLGDLQTDLERTASELAGYQADLDRQTRQELAMLVTGLGADANDLVQRAVHQLFETTIRNGTLDFHLRAEYDLTYDEYLSGMSYSEMSPPGGFQPGPR